MKKILVFGSTGSIGKNALEVIKQGSDQFRVIGLCANQDIDALWEQVKEFKPSYVCLVNQERAEELNKILPKSVELFTGQEGLEKFSSLSSDISLMAISGISCLGPLLINIKSSKRIALANKEAIVCAGSLVFKTAKKYKTEIIPVDSEINALFQLIGRPEKGDLRKIFLTASGGALANYDVGELDKAGVEEVLNHPTWSMGKRVTIDSATLVNKAFEVVEAHRFFDMPYEDIGIVIHKESIIHALIQYQDNSLLACLYPPDMKMPISHALYYPKRLKSKYRDELDKPFNCNFKPINFERYPLLKLVLDAAKRDDNSLAILNAVDEVAIDYFLNKKIKFTDMHKVMKSIFKNYPSNKINNIKDLKYWDRWGREKAKEFLDKL